MAAATSKQVGGRGEVRRIPLPGSRPSGGRANWREAAVPACDSAVPLSGLLSRESAQALGPSSGNPARIFPTPSVTVQQASLGRARFGLGSMIDVSERVDWHDRIVELCEDVEMTTHCFDHIAQRRDEQVGAALQL
jgi:hypothetical protein